MKLRQFILSTAAAVVFAAPAFAADNTATIDIVGSTAFRSTINADIRALVTPATLSYAYTGTDVTKASQTIVKGTLVASPGTAVIIRTSFTGSVEGIQAITSGANDQFLPVTTPTSPAGFNGASASPNTITAGTDPATADLTLSDVYQSTTIYTTPALAENIVAVVPFKFITNKDCPTTVTNMTTQLFRTTYSAGAQDLSLYTGSAADEGLLVYAIGRYNLSGTRFTILAENRYGVNTGVNQLQPTVSGGVITSFGNSSNSGYINGGDLIPALTATSVTGTGADGTGYCVGYLGLSDATTALGSGAHELAYNGVTYSAGAVQNGLYTLWGYEHLYSKTGTLQADVASAKQSLITAIKAAPGGAGLTLTSMNVVRGTDGSNVGPNF